MIHGASTEEEKQAKWKRLRDNLQRMQWMAKTVHLKTGDQVELFETTTNICLMLSKNNLTEYHAEMLGQALLDIICAGKVLPTLDDEMCALKARVAELGGGDYVMVRCGNCQREWANKVGLEKVESCPFCIANAAIKYRAAVRDYSAMSNRKHKWEESENAERRMAHASNTLIKICNAAIEAEEATKGGG